MKIVSDSISLDELRQMAARFYGEMVKAVVDLGREVIALDADLHSDLEALLLENGSEQNDLWGINLYPELDGDAFLEFDSTINLRPSQGNKSRGVESPETRDRISTLVARRVMR